jgi:type I restriction enzyme S subunit
MNTPALVGEVGYVEKDEPDLFLPDRLWLARARAGLEVDMRWLAYTLSSEEGARRIRDLATGTSGSMKNIPKSKLLKMEIQVPPFAEQVTIGGILTDVVDLIAALERLMAKKRSIKQGMMQQLLTGKTRLPGFTEKWSRVTVNSLGTFLKGRGVKRDEVRSQGIPCIRYGELYTTFYDYTSTTVSFVEAEVAASALPIRCGDVLFAGSGETKAEIGTCVAYIGKSPAVAGGDIIVLRGAGFNPIFLASLLNMPSLAADKARAGQGDAVVHINSRAIGALDIRIPVFHEQNAIARAIQDADLEIEALERRLLRARHVQRGMMQELLTGRTRLNVADASG